MERFTRDDGCFKVRKKVKIRNQYNQVPPALALVDVLGVFTSEIGFRTPKIQRSDVL